ncbi:MAG: DUF971 domain-containing protein [Ignavibacteriaceae bacterium]
MNPKQIKIEDKTKLLIKWEDDSESRLNLKYLRDECPCANCKGETILFKTYRPERKTEEKPEMYKIKNIEIVGGYAIQILWKDGHDTGIYSWEYIKKLVSSQDSGISEEYNNLI